MGGELHRQLVELHAGTRALAVERQRHLRLVGQVEGEVVRALGADVGPLGEHRQRWLLERDRDDPRALGELLAGAQVERHAGPAPVVDLDPQRHEGLGVGVVGDLLLAAVAGVLAAHDVVGLDRLHRPEDLELLVADRVRRERGRRLHRGERQHLHQVGDDHVAVGAGGLVELRAALEPERLGDVDLHVVDEVAVPDRLEETVGEAEGQDVLRGLLAQEVVDAEDLRLVEDLVHAGVELLGRLQVGAERLLHDDPRALDEVALLQLLEHRQRRLRRDREVVQPPLVVDVAGQQRLDAVDLRGQGLGAGGLRDVGQHRREPGPHLVGQVLVGEVLARLAGQLHELLGVEVLQRGPHDAGVLEQVGLEEVQQPRQQLAPRQVTGRSEEHDDGRLLHVLDSNHLLLRGGDEEPTNRPPWRGGRAPAAAGRP